MISVLNSSSGYCVENGLKGLLKQKQKTHLGDRVVGQVGDSGSLQSTPASIRGREGLKFGKCSAGRK